MDTKSIQQMKQVVDFIVKQQHKVQCRHKLLIFNLGDGLFIINIFVDKIYTIHWKKNQDMFISESLALLVV